MKKKLLIALASIAIAVPAFASPVAQGNFGVTLPLLQVNQVFGMGDYDDSFGDVGDITFNTMEAQVGYFAVDNLEVFALIEYVAEQGDGFDDTKIFGLGMNYYMDMGTELMPFVGLSLRTDASGDDTQWGIGADLGAAYMMGENTAAYGALNVLHWDDGDVLSGQVFGLEAGVKFFF